MERSLEQRSWFSQWLTSPLIRRPVYSPAMENEQAATHVNTAAPAIELLLADLSCDLVCSEQLTEQLPGLLVPVTTWYQRLLARFDVRFVAVCIPAITSDQTIEILLDTPSKVSHTPIRNHTRPCWIELPLSRHPEISTASASANPSDATASPSTSISAWLRVSDCPAKHHDDIHALLAPLRRAMVKGLSGWWNHQHTLHQERRDTLERERRWQAAELHDSVAQVLGYVRLRSAQLATRCHSMNDESLASHADDLSQQCHHAYRQTRELIAMSRLAISGDQFIPALREAIADIESRCTLVFELDNRCGELALTDVQATQALYIVREALCNVVRHARASHVRIKLYDMPNQQRILLVEDNGTGIQRTRREGSFGLQIMAERAQRMGGKLMIRQRQPNGTRIELTLPSDSHPF